MLDFYGLYVLLLMPTFINITLYKNGMGKVKLKFLSKEHISFLQHYCLNFIFLPLSSPPKISASR